MCEYRPGGRRRHEPVPGLSLRQLGHGLRRRRVPPGLRHGAPDPLAPRHGRGDRRPRDHRRGAGRRVAPSDAAPPAGTGRRARAAGVQRDRARVLPVPRLVRGGVGEGVAGLVAAHLDDRGLPAPADVARGVHPAPHPQRNARRRHPRGVLQGRGRPWPARSQCHLRRGARDGGPPSGVQERHQGDRRAGRPGGHVHGQVDDGRRRLVVPRPHQPVGQRTVATR